MTATYEIQVLLEKVRNEKRKQYHEMKKLIEKETFFKKFRISKLACTIKIDTLEEFEKWLSDDLKKATIMEERES